MIFGCACKIISITEKQKTERERKRMRKRKKQKILKMRKVEGASRNGASYILMDRYSG